jgi:hypothetical protein
VSAHTPGGQTGDFAERAERHRLDGDAVRAIEVAEAGLERNPDDLRGRIALALARIDLGDVLQARDELATVLGGKRDAAPTAAHEAVSFDSFDSSDADDPLAQPGLGEAVGDDELETAFAEAESQRDEMMDANRVVEQTLRAAELDTPEADDTSDEDFDMAGNQTYATESMAMLLDSQGRRAEAQALRHSLASRGAQPPSVEALPEAEALDAAEADDIELDAPEDIAQAPDSTAWEQAGFGPDHARQLQVVATLEGWLHNLKRQAERNPGRASAGRGSAGGTA